MAISFIASQAAAVTTTQIILPLAVEGEDAPTLSDGSRWRGLGIPRINNDGEVAFDATTTRVVGNDDVITESVWLLSQNSAHRLAAEGQTLPQATTNTLFGDDMRGVNLNDSGDVVFATTLSDGLGTTAAAQDSAVVVANVSGTRLVAQEGTAIPGASDGAVFAELVFAPGLFDEAARINDSGDVLFLAVATGQELDLPRPTRLLYGTSGGLQTIAEPGQPAPGTSDGTLSVAARLPALNNSGKIAYAELGNTRDIYLGSGPSSVQPLLSVGDTAPGFGPTSVFDLIRSDLVINNAGQVGFTADIRDGGQSLQVLYQGDENQITPVFVENGAIPGVDSSLEISRFGSVSINDTGDMSFQASFTTPGGIFNEQDSDRALLITDGSAVKLIAMNGQDVPGLEGEYYLSLSIGSPVRSAINNQGDLVFRAEITTINDPTIPITDTETALFFYDSLADELSLVLREGDLVDFNTDPNVETLRPVRTISAFSTSDAGLSSILNDDGLIAISLSTGTAGITHGVFLVDPRGTVIPEPGSAVVFLLLSMGIVRRGQH